MKKVWVHLPKPATTNKNKQKKITFGKIFQGFVSSHYSWHILGLGKTNSLFSLASKEIFGTVMSMQFIRTTTFSEETATIILSLDLLLKEAVSRTLCNAFLMYPQTFTSFNETSPQSIESNTRSAFWQEVFLLPLSLWYFSVAPTGVILINLHSISSYSYLRGQRLRLSKFLTAVMCDKCFCSRQECNEWPEEKGHGSGDLFQLGSSARLVHQEWHDCRESVHRLHYSTATLNIKWVLQDCLHENCGRNTWAAS